MIYYAVGYSRLGHIGFDIGEYDTIQEAIDAAVKYGATPPSLPVVDAADMTFIVDNGMIWIQRRDEDCGPI